MEWWRHCFGIYFVRRDCWLFERLSYPVLFCLFFLPHDDFNGTGETVKGFSKWNTKWVILNEIFGSFWHLSVDFGFLKSWSLLVFVVQCFLYQIEDSYLVKSLYRWTWRRSSDEIYFSFDGCWKYLRFRIYTDSTNLNRWLCT